MHDTVVTNVKTSGSITGEFPFTINFFLGLVFSLYLFALVMDKLSQLLWMSALDLFKKNFLGICFLQMIWF